jgi:murein DD-endopeptidase MepM/ murein hydrolase activator NlpD
MSTPQVFFFPVRIPENFKPSSLAIRADGTDCPCQKEPYRPRWGGGFLARRGNGLHKALDIMAPEGAEILSVGYGVIPEKWKVSRRDIRPGAGLSAKGGNYVVVMDPDGFEWYYAHMRDTPLVKPGDQIVPGQLLGYVGRTGNAVRKYKDGTVRGCPHLHIRVQRGASPSSRKLDVKPLLEGLYKAL